jgi:hypothetical protein
MRAAALAVVLVLAVSAGCGIPVDDQPRDAGSAGDVLASRPPLDLDGGTEAERLCFVRDGRLVRVARRVPRPVDAQQQLQALLDGPTETESAAGLTSALTGTTPTIQLTLTAGRASVEVGDRSEHGVRNDENLAFGQVVCTLASRAEIGTVSFTSEGRPLGVPRQDGSLTLGPLTVADYAQLIDQ